MSLSLKCSPDLDCRSARMEANNKLSEEKQVKKANEVSVKSNHAEEAEGAKRLLVP